jgi:excisionase family DNA binding protein
MSRFLESSAPKTLLTVDEACAYLRISRATIYRLIKRKAFPAFRLTGGLAGGWRINIEDLDRWIKYRSTSGNPPSQGNC